eukprot:CAMPEP_0119071030 /NCGR_PEP_ID=MMETSP1178-20130426/47524_1 /TAXON_ID=33656 /ORGANISM="unid sp, Strain CCMP2000" /LENGTH=51 /DNA_ID=CAMNT_0007052921 /DNA_START=262 /DNA_END=417 /DNA_ORIENTATION=-
MRQSPKSRVAKTLNGSVLSTREVLAERGVLILGLPIRPARAVRLQLAQPLA